MARWRLGAALPASVVLVATLDEYLLGLQGVGPWPLVWTALVFGATLGLAMALAVRLFAAPTQLHRD